MRESKIRKTPAIAFEKSNEPNPQEKGGYAKSMLPKFTTGAIIMIMMTCCHSFMIPHSSSLRSTVGKGTNAKKMIDDHENNVEHGSSHDGGRMMDLETAREAFERSVALFSDMDDEEQPQAVVLTASIERIKEMEIEMLNSLENSDDAIDPIVDLWTKERPHSHAAQQLIDMETYCSPGLLKEEKALRTMIDEYADSGWIEPQSRLAVLLFIKGRYEESAELCQYVLHEKPWHFEIGRLLVVIYLRMDMFGIALQVARHYMLPELNDNTSNRRRKQWVNAATSVAKEQLQEARKDAVLAVHTNPVDECSLDNTVNANAACWE